MINQKQEVSLTVVKRNHIYNHGILVEIGKTTYSLINSKVKINMTFEN